MLKQIRIVALLLCLVVCRTAFAGVEPPVIQTLTGASILQGGPTTVTTVLPGFWPLNSAWDDHFKIKQIDAFVAVYLDTAVHNFINFDFQLNVPVNITWWVNGNSVPFTGQRELIISYNPQGGTQYRQLDAWYNGADVCRVIAEIDQANVTLTTLNGSALLSVAQVGIVAQSVKLKNEIRVERYYQINLNVPLSASQIWHLPGTSISGIGRDLDIRWQEVPGAESYQLEWVYIDDYDVAGYKLPQNVPFSFQDNIARVEVRARQNVPYQYYRLPLVYQHGYIVYRVRTVGRSMNDLEKRVFTPWSDPCNGCPLANFNPLFTQNFYAITVPHENDALNWQCVTTYAEDGKRQDVIQYMDGTMRPRQSVSVVYADQPGQSYAVVEETIYDRQGRPAIQAPSTPTHFSTVPELGFHRDFNLETITGMPYDWTHFDKDATIGPSCTASPATMSPASGASRYYSSSNTFSAGSIPMKSYIPDAFGYPFTQVEYTPDNTGRIRRQSGPGKDHRMDSGHEVEFFYGVPAQEELDRLFGNEVGNALHYDKKMTRDPNGQLTVIYLDPKGNTIGTALAGNPPSNVEALPSYQVRTLTIDLLAFNRRNDLNHALETEYTLLVNTAGDVAFNYSVTGAGFQDACMPPGACYDCIYDLEISVVDHLNCGDILFSNTQTIGQLYEMDGLGQPILDADGNPVLSLTCASPAFQALVPFSCPLAVGSYKVIKKLKVNEAAADAYVEHYLHDPNNICTNIKDQLLQAALAAIDFSDCGIDCQMLTSDLNNPVLTGAMTPEELLELEDDQYGLCNPQATRCEAAYQAMLQDVSPFGQYGEVLNQSGDDWQVSVFNMFNNLEPTPVSFRNLIIYDAFGNPAMLTNNLGNPVAANDFSISLTEFIAHWQPEWAASLVSIHPEYCYYEFCINELSKTFPVNGQQLTSETFDADLLATDTYTDAQAKGYMGTYALANFDPYFNATGSPGLTLKPLMYGFMDDYNGNGAGTQSMLALATALGTTPDNLWIAYRSLYLSTKEKFLYAERTQYAIENGCYNGCIGDADLGHFEPAFFDFLDQHPPSDAVLQPDGNPYMDDPRQPCYWTTAHRYENKVPRFHTIYNALPDFPGDFYADPPDQQMLENLEEDAETEVESECGDCEWGEEMSDFLFYLYSIAPNTYTLNTSSPFAPDVIAAFLNGGSSTSFGIGNSGTMIDITTGSCRILIEKPSSASIQDFCCLMPNSGSFWKDPNSEFNHCVLNATYATTGLTVPIEVLYTDGCPNICCNETECPPTQQAQDLLGLFNSLVLQNTFTTTHIVNSTAIPTSIGNPNPATVYHWAALSPTSFYLDIGTGAIPCFFNFILPSGFNFSQAAQILSLTADETQMDAMQHTKGFVLQVLTQTGQVVEVRGSNTCYYISYCCTPYPDDMQPKPVSDEEIWKDCSSCIQVSVQGGLLDGVSTECPDPCEPLVEVVGTIDDGNPCMEQLIAVATLNAQQQYQQFLDDLRPVIRAQYMEHCLSAAQETFSAVLPDATHHYTLYFYDQANNLVKTVPPLGVKPLTAASDLQQVKDYRKGIVSNPKFPGHLLPSIYAFNSLNQLRQQTIPDHRDPNNVALPGTTVFYYDALGRLAASQNPRQAGQGWFYAYTIFDPLGRVIEVGEIQAGNALTPAIARNVPAGAWMNWIANGTKQQITGTQYDEPLPGLSPAVIALFGSGQENLRGRVTAAYYTGQQGQTYETATYYSYDIHGNVKTLVQDISGLGEKRIEYEYDLIGGQVNRVSYQRRERDQFSHVYSYDRNNRLRTVFTSPNALIWDKAATYVYYPHGPLARMVLGNDQVQGLDDIYTIQGWLKGVNSVQQTNGVLDPGHDGFTWSNNRWTAQDAMGFTLGYYAGDYKSIDNIWPFEIRYAGSYFDTDAPGLYNGNIRQMVTAIQPFMSGGTPAMGFAYNYDQLNRLLRARAYDKVDNLNTILANWASNASTPNYSQAIRYDANGNISRNLRYRKGNVITRQMDNLRYTYYPQTNRLRRVRDNVSASAHNGDLDDQNATDNYKYDATGNLTDDVSEGLRYKWNLQNKVRTIVRGTTPDLDFRYDALGNRVMKKHHGTNTTTWYIMGADGNLMATYHQTPTELVWESALLYGSGRLGEYRAELCLSGNCSPPITKIGQIDRIRGKQFYELTNHLGNVLAIISDRKIQGTYNGTTLGFYRADVVSATDYYAFGMEMPGRTLQSGKGRFGFNGMVKDDEVKQNGNSYSTYYRENDPRLGRWLSIDPKINFFESPYTDMNNNPIVFNDPNGDKVEVDKEAKRDVRYLKRHNRKFRDDYKKWKSDPKVTFYIHKVDVSLPGYSSPVSLQEPMISDLPLKHIGKDIPDGNYNIKHIYYNAIAGPDQGDYAAYKVRFIESVSKTRTFDKGETVVEIPIESSMPDEYLPKWNRKVTHASEDIIVDLEINNPSSKTNIVGTVNNYIYTRSGGITTNQGAVAVTDDYQVRPVEITITATAISREVNIKVPRNIFGKLNWNKMETNYKFRKGEGPSSVTKRDW